MTATRPSDAVRGILRAGFARAKASIASLSAIPPAPPRGAGLATLLRHAIAADTDWRSSIDAARDVLMRDVSKAERLLATWRATIEQLRSAADVLDGKATTLRTGTEGAVRMATALLAGTPEAPQTAALIRTEIGNADRVWTTVAGEVVKARSAAGVAYLAWCADRATDARRTADATTFATRHRAAAAAHKALLRRCDDDLRAVLAEHLPAGDADEGERAA